MTHGCGSKGSATRSFTSPPRLRGASIPGFPRELEAVCLKALEKRPEDRYESAQELAHDLHRWLEGKPTKAGKAGPVTRFTMLVKRRRALSAAAAAVTLLLASAASERCLSQPGGGQGKSRPRPLARGRKRPGIAQRAEAAEEREQALQREKNLVALQRLRTSSHADGWFDEVRSKVRALRGADLDPQLQAQAAAALEGIDAKFRKTFPGWFQQVAFDPRANRLLIHGIGPKVQGRPTFLTALWDRATDMIVVEKDLGRGVIAFHEDGTPLQLSQSGEDPAALTLYDVTSSRPLHQFRSPGQSLSNITALTLSRTGKHLAVVARPVHKGPDGRSVPIGVATTLAVWNAASGDLVGTLDHKATVGLVLSPDGRLLAAWDEAGEITVWLLPEGRALTHFRVSRARVNCLAFGRDPVWHARPAVNLPPWLLAVGDSGGLITVWDLSTNQARIIAGARSS